VRLARGKFRKYKNAEGLQGELGDREALRRLFPYLIALRGPLLLGFLCSALYSSANLGYGWLVSRFIDLITKYQGTGMMGPVNQLVWLGIGVFIVRGVLYFATHYTWNYAGQKLSLRLRNEIFAHLQRLHVSFFDHRKTGQLMSAISNDVPAVNNVLTAAQDSINAPVLVICGTAILFFLNWKLALVSCIALPPTAAIIMRATRRARETAGQVQSHLSEVTSHAEETISGIRVVKSFGNEDYEIERFAEKSGRVTKAILKNLRTKLTMVPVVELLGAMAIIAVLWIAGAEIVKNPTAAFTVGDMFFFVIVLQQVANGAKNLGQISVNLTTSSVAADRVFTLLSCKSEIQEKPEAIDLKRVQGRVVFDDVTFGYSAGIPVLAGISFVMEPGEVVALVGPTGAGKSTIGALVPRFYDVSAGRITVDGVDVRDCALNSLRSQIGIVPQDTILFAGTVRENIAYGRLGATEDEIIAAAKMANAWEFIERMPEGLETRIGERGVTLSGGQRQRIAIARAVLRDPRILILDEATSSLDTQSEALVQDALQKLVAERTTLVIAHRLSTIRNADKILVIADGHITEAGRHEELLALNGTYAELYRTQFRHQEPSGRRALEQ
jgi:ATP-binding cassette, subfamily B, bacterial MsbA